MESLLAQQNRLRSLLKRPQHADMFRLDALADNFLAPLEDRLTRQQYLCGERLGGADCMAYGYLSLMLLPKVPKRWLADAIEKKYAKVRDYFSRMRDEFESMERDKPPVRVEWQVLSSSGAMKMASNAVLDGLPVSTSKINASGPSNEPSTQGQSTLYPLTISLGVAAAAALATFSYFQPYGGSSTSDASEPISPQSAHLASLGEAGDILSAFGQHMEIEADMGREKERTGGAVISEVDVSL